MAADGGRCGGGLVKLTDVQSSVAQLLAQGMSPPGIAEELGMTRQGVHEVAKRLTVMGLLRLLGDLPRHAVATTYPDRSASVLCSVLPDLGWRPDELSRIRRDECRGGIVPPPNQSPELWSGQAIRVVDWQHGEVRWCVQGALTVSPDGSGRSRSTPWQRSVIVHRKCQQVGADHLARGGVTTSDLAWIVAPGNVSADERVGLTLAVAWVLESRALLDIDMLQVTTVLSGG